MKTVKMLAILFMALGLMVLPASVASGAQSLTVNGQPVKSITLEVGQSCTVEVVSDDSRSYTDYVGFDNGLVRGTFLHMGTMPAAGNSATVTEYDERAFYGYYIVADGLFRPPSAGIHFVFEYESQEVGETDLKLYQNNPPPLAGPLLDSVHITVIPAPMGTAITYQGSLNDTGSPADGLYDFQFKLYDSIIGGNQEGNTIDINDVDVIEGQFVVELDFGSGSDIFGGDARWLQVGVRPGDSNGVHTRLSPRIELMPTPYAIYAKNAGDDGDWVVSGNNMYSIPSGNVGIGTTNPGRILDVDGKIRLRGGAAGNPGIWLTDSSDVEEWFLGKTNVGGTNQIGMYKNDWKMVVQDTGNVGIGTTTPTTKLDVVGTVTATSFVGNGSGLTGIVTGDSDWIISGNNMYSGVSGNVGIGTTSPGAGLHLKGTGHPATFMYLQSDAGEDTGFRLYEDTAVKWHFYNDSDLDGLSLRNNTATVLFARQSTGSVGIGTINPLSKLSVGGDGRSDSAIYGSGSDNGVYGSGSSNGVYGISSSTGVKGYAGSETGRGVEGLAGNNGYATNYGGYFKAEGVTGRGVYGWCTGSEGYGVMGTGYVAVRGESAYNDGAGVSGESLSDSGYGVKAINSHSSGTGLYATGGSNGYAAEFDGDVRVNGNLEVYSGSTLVLELGSGLDYAEGFDVSANKEISPGSVLIIDADNPGKLAMSDKAYDSKVAGIVAGGKGLGSGVRLGGEQFDYDVALAGRVYCNVDTTDGCVEPGDLLTTSDTPGYAMKSTDYARAQGAILGKAMQSLQKGQKGQILVLITLQ